MTSEYTYYQFLTKMNHKNWQHVETLTGQKEKVGGCQFGCYKYQLD